MNVHDLLLPEAELVQLTEAMANANATVPLDTLIAEALQTVADFTAAYEITAERQTRLARALVIHRAYSLIGTIPENHQTAYDAAMAELKDIRDGKFSTLPPALTPPTPAAGGRWGSRPKIL